MKALTAYLLPAIALAPMTVACGGSNGGESSGPSDTATQDGGGAVATTGSGSSGGGGSGGSGGSGRATLTVGDRTWEFEGYQCIVDYDEGSPLNSTARVEVDGRSLELWVDIIDYNDEGRREGDGVAYEVSLEDITSRADAEPIVWGYAPDEFTLSQRSPDAEDLEPFRIRINGDRVTVEGWFFDDQKPSPSFYDASSDELSWGTFEGRCR